MVYVTFKKKRNSNIAKLQFQVFSFWILVTNNDAHEWVTLCFRKTVPGERDFIYLKVSLPPFEIQQSSGSLHLSPPPSKMGIFLQFSKAFPDAWKTPNPLLALDVCKISVEQSLWISFQDFATEGFSKPQLKKDLGKLNLLINGWQSKTQNCMKLDGKITSMYERFPPFSSPEA